MLEWRKLLGRQRVPLRQETRVLGYICCQLLQEPRDNDVAPTHRQRSREGDRGCQAWQRGNLARDGHYPSRVRGCVTTGLCCVAVGVAVKAMLSQCTLLHCVGTPRGLKLVGSVSGQHDERRLCHTHRSSRVSQPSPRQPYSKSIVSVCKHVPQKHIMYRISTQARFTGTLSSV